MVDASLMEPLRLSEHFPPPTRRSLRPIHFRPTQGIFLKKKAKKKKKSNFSCHFLEVYSCVLTLQTPCVRCESLVSPEVDNTTQSDGFQYSGCVK